MPDGPSVELKRRFVVLLEHRRELLLVVGGLEVTHRCTVARRTEMIISYLRLSPTGCWERRITGGACEPVWTPRYSCRAARTRCPIDPRRRTLAHDAEAAQPQGQIPRVARRTCASTSSSAVSRH